MTAALASHVDTVDLPAEPGVSTRAVRAVLRMMAKIANDAGEFRYGLRGSKLAALTDYSLSVVRRAQRYLVEHGYFERVKVGGGRASTRWRIPIHKLRPDHEQRPSSDAAPTHQPDPATQPRAAPHGLSFGGTTPPTADDHHPTRRR